jgi:hypothetical protein
LIDLLQDGDGGPGKGFVITHIIQGCSH